MSKNEQATYRPKDFEKPGRPSCTALLRTA